MKVPLTWLAEYVPLTLPPVELAHWLTMAGIEATYQPGASDGWSKVFVGVVTQVEVHPNAERLRLVTIDLGNESSTVVCGAPNVAKGQRIAFAYPGARLVNPTNGKHFTLAEATIRGVLSAGMVCSERELGLGESHEGILILDESAPVGLRLDEFIQDGVLDLEVTPNRGDCLSILGVAREVAAITGQTVTEPVLDYVEEGPDIADSITIRIDNPELCTRYLATLVKGIRIGPSPQWMQQQLVLAGMRPINNVVDVTNFVMLEYGQPLHAFDLAAVQQNTIIVRSAREGELLKSLDGQDRVLQPPMLLITDPQRALGLAGVMGGANSEMTNETVGVLIESATFNPINTRRTSQVLRLRTEAATRFEKGLSPELAKRAIRRATSLIIATAGGRADRGIADAFPGQTQKSSIRLRVQRLRHVLGVAIPTEQVSLVLQSLGFLVEPEQGNSPDTQVLAVTPPYWRTDVAIEEDVIEEVARTIGYDRVPATPLEGQVPDPSPQPIRALREEVTTLLIETGMQEVISYSLVSRKMIDAAGLPATVSNPTPLQVANPMSQEQEHLRISLRSGVLRTLSATLRLSSRGTRLFEAGKVYVGRSDDLPDEREMVFGVLAGPRGESFWGGDNGSLDFYDAKGVVTGILERLGINAQFVRGADKLLHPGRAADILVGPRLVGIVGELHPSVIASFDLDSAIIACFELDLGHLLPLLPTPKYQYSPFSRFPTADRDLALVVDDQVSAGQLQIIIEGHPLVIRAIVFDLFSGSSLPAGKKSLAFRVELQSETGTLSTEQVNEAISSVVQRLETEVSASLRT